MQIYISSCKKDCSYIKLSFSMQCVSLPQYLGWFGSGGSEWDRSARALLRKIFVRFWKLASFPSSDSETFPPHCFGYLTCASPSTFWFWNFPSHMLFLPRDQVLLVSLITINDGHLHRHPVQVHHSPHLTRIHINHLQGQPTRTNATTRSTKLVFSLPEMEVYWQRHPGPARWWSSEGFRWLSCHTTIKVSPHI